MPGIYKKKQCPTCGTEHRKKGAYCSRSCGNHRTFDDAAKVKLSLAQQNFLQSEAGEEQKYRLQQMAKNRELDWHINPPVDRGGEVLDGDFWVEGD